jgi:hypothetical protein
LIQIWSESAERAFQFVEVGDALLEIRDMRLIANRSVFLFPISCGDLRDVDFSSRLLWASELARLPSRVDGC